jgi:putative peptidoglycan lipid II flippase
MASAFYALGETKPPLYAALVRVTLTGVLGYAFALPLREYFGYSGAWGAFALTATAGVAAWVELTLLHRWLGRRIGHVPLPVKFELGVGVLAILAGAAGYSVSVLAATLGFPGWVASLGAVATFGAVYLAGAIIRKVPEANAFTRRLRRR